MGRDGIRREASSLQTENISLLFDTSSSDGLSVHDVRGDVITADSLEGMMMESGTARALAAVMLTVLTACGDRSLSTSTSGPTGTTTVPTIAGSDVPGNSTATTPDPEVGNWFLTFEAGKAWGPDGHGEGGYWESRLLASGETLLLTAFGEGQDSSALDLFRSEDGITWTPVELDLRQEVGSLDIAFAEVAGFVIGGFTFEGESFDSWMLTSPDGLVWTEPAAEHGSARLASTFFETEGPEPGIYGSITSMVQFRDLVIASGNDDGSPAIWVSEDASEWKSVGLDLADEAFGAQVDGLAVVGERIYAVGNNPGMTVWRSDDGLAWDEIAGPEAFGVEEVASGFDEGHESLHAGSFLGVTEHRGALIALIQVERRRGDEWCFVDASTCNVPSLELVTSTDGSSWHALSLPDDPTLVWQASLQSIDDTAVLAEASDGRVQVWTLGDPGPGTPIDMPQRPELGFDVAQYGDTLEPGVTYGLPLWAHCGLDRLGEFNGEVWGIVEDHSGDLPQDDASSWSEMLYGTVILVAPNRIEYSVGDVLVAIYAPLENPEEQFCA